jgi:hypothetical protein
MKMPIMLGLLAVLSLIPMPSSAAERACRPSLSNMYHCPDTSKPAPPTTKPAPRATEGTSNSARPCRPSLSNLWTCPETSKARQRTTRAARPCRPSLSNGYHCPGTEPNAPAKPTTAERNAPEKPARTTSAPGENQYSTERQAWSHCASDTVVWANTRSNIYHFRGTHNYGSTVAGAYMCEHDAIAEGMRAAKNETHP